MIDYQNALQEIRITIWRASEKVLADMRLSWERFEIFPHISMNRWEIIFFESGKICCSVSFFRPPNAGENWYEREITNQIQKHLMTV